MLLSKVLRFAFQAAQDMKFIKRRDGKSEKWMKEFWGILAMICRKVLLRDRFSRSGISH
jgi:hypothetical protein